jgi:glutamyl-tRNA synthetase
MTPARTRIAPSPTGDPHVGTAYQAVFNKAVACATGGRFLLRIEDTDRARLNPESEGMIYRALRWLSLPADESPEVGGPVGPYRQSERLPLYAEHADRLVDSGAAYRCFCTSERLERLKAGQAAAKQPPRYDRLCSAIPREEARARAKTEAHVVRLLMPSEGVTVVRDGLRGDVPFENALLDDQVLLKSDGFPTYHLAVVVDDHHMGITHVVRGEEWLPSTPKHVLLYAAFGWTEPQWFHTPLLRNPDRSKLSKRRNPTSLDWYRDRGYLPEALVNFLCTMGWSHPEGKDMFGWGEFVERFTLERIHLGGPIFDLEKLLHLNGLWMRSLTPGEIERRILTGGFTRHAAAEPGLLRSAVTLIHDRIVLLSEFDELTAYFFEDLAPKRSDLVGKLASPDVSSAMTAVQGALDGLPEWSAASIEGCVRGVAEGGPLKKKDLFMCLRVAVTGRPVSTPLFETMAAVGREVVFRRLASALAQLPS